MYGIILGCGWFMKFEERPAEDYRHLQLKLINRDSNMDTRFLKNAYNSLKTLVVGEIASKISLPPSVFC